MRVPFDRNQDLDLPFRRVYRRIRNRTVGFREGSGTAAYLTAGSLVLGLAVAMLTPFDAELRRALRGRDATPIVDQRPVEFLAPNLTSPYSEGFEVPRAPLGGSGGLDAEVSEHEPRWSVALSGGWTRRVAPRDFVRGMLRGALSLLRGIVSIDPGALLVTSSHTAAALVTTATQGWSEAIGIAHTLATAPWLHYRTSQQRGATAPEALGELLLQPLVGVVGLGFVAGALAANQLIRNPVLRYRLLNAELMQRQLAPLLWNRSLQRRRVAQSLSLGPNSDLNHILRAMSQRSGTIHFDELRAQGEGQQRISGDAEVFYDAEWAPFLDPSNERRLAEWILREDLPPHQFAAYSMAPTPLRALLRYAAVRLSFAGEGDDDPPERARYADLFGSASRAIDHFNRTETTAERLRYGSTPHPLRKAVKRAPPEDLQDVVEFHRIVEIPLFSLSPAGFRRIKRSVPPNEFLRFVGAYSDVIRQTPRRGEQRPSLVELTAALNEAISHASTTSEGLRQRLLEVHLAGSLEGVR